MASYLTYIYTCNHLREELLHVGRTLAKSFEYLSKSDDKHIFWKVLETVPEDDDEVDNIMDWCQDTINTDKCLIVNVPIEYFDRIVDKTMLDDDMVDTHREHLRGEYFNIFVLKTNDNGTFRKQMDNVMELISI